MIGDFEARPSNSLWCFAAAITPAALRVGSAREVTTVGVRCGQVCLVERQWDAERVRRLCEGLSARAERGLIGPDRLDVRRSRGWRDAVHESGLRREKAWWSKQFVDSVGRRFEQNC